MTIYDDADYDHDEADPGSPTEFGDPVDGVALSTDGTVARINYRVVADFTADVPVDELFDGITAADVYANHGNPDTPDGKAEALAAELADVLPEVLGPRTELVDPEAAEYHLVP